MSNPSDYFKDRMNKIKMFNEFFGSRNKKDCVTKRDTLLSGRIRIEKRIGIPSINGEIFKVCFGENRKTVKNSCEFEAVVKKIPLSQQALKYIPYQNYKEVVESFSAFTESFFLKLTDLLVKKGITPHIPYSLKPLTCSKDCNFVNEDILDQVDNIKGCELLVVELEDGTLDELLESKVLSNFEILIAFFQIFMGIYCIKKYFSIEHYDLHAGNILYKKIPKGGRICYKVGKKTLSIPNIGYIFMIWDFGFARIRGKIEQPRYRNNYSRSPSKFYDLFRITSVVKTYPVDRAPLDVITHFLEQIKKSPETENEPVKVIRMLLEELCKIINKNDLSGDYTNCIATFDTDKKINRNLLPKLKGI